MEEIKKDIFGQYRPYENVVLTDEENIQVLGVLNSIADQLQDTLGDDEFIRVIGNIRSVVQWVVGEVNKYLPDNIERVDGNCIEPLVKQVIAERIIANK